MYYAPMCYLSSTFEFSPRVEHNVHSISASRSQERRKYRWPVVYWWNRTLVYVCYFNVLLAPWGSAGRGDLTASKAPCTRALYTSFGSKRGRLMAQQSRFRLPCACRKDLARLSSHPTAFTALPRFLLNAMFSPSLCTKSIYGQGGIRCGRWGALHNPTGS